ncbi:tryptophan N-monooxygenase CYP79A68-like [Humulus lupulus]|uniref:tryptophan N-monooxygenase CYP79A68-like n=1 Tax=Humulus lupulus TaxID=3486 RepID=UPI002B40C67D|nr:tryptophan N-monooxygenase CYP79A68-like [Humulus lupulus]
MEGSSSSLIVRVINNSDIFPHNKSYYYVPSYHYSYYLHKWGPNSKSNSTAIPHDEETITVMLFIALLLFIIIIVLLLLLKNLFVKLLIISSSSNKKQQPTATTLPPGPSPWPILGNIPEMLRNRPAYQWIHRLMKELNTDIACIRLGTATNLITVTSPEIAREFLKKHDAALASRPDTVVTSLISRGYKTTALTPSGNRWKKMRRVLVSELFNRSKLAWLLQKRTEEADDLVRFVYNQALASSGGGDGRAGGVVDVKVAAKQYAAGVMRRMIFGRGYSEKGSDGRPGKEEEEHVEAVLTVLSHVYVYSVSDILPWLRWFDLDGHQRTVGEAIKVINNHQDPIISERIREWREDGHDAEAKKQPSDLLDVLISAKDSDGNPLLSDDEIRAQVTELLLAGIDNPYNAAEWALSEMLNQPEMLEKATEEIDRVVGSGSGKLLQESDIPQLPYLVACAREALRLHPVTAFNLPHLSTADCTVAGYFIPKGSHVLLSRHGLGRNPAVWDQPLRFNPERHLPENKCDLGESELRFISFSAGRRGCVGMGLGTNMTIMLLGRLLQCFTWTMPQGVEKIDLRSEESSSLFKATPLYAHAKPRFSPSLYTSLSHE